MSPADACRQIKEVCKGVAGEVREVKGGVYKDTCAIADPVMRFSAHLRDCHSLK